MRQIGYWVLRFEKLGVGREGGFLEAEKIQGRLLPRDHAIPLCYVWAVQFLLLTPV
jgi:hypothetical protein